MDIFRGDNEKKTLKITTSEGKEVDIRVGTNNNFNLLAPSATTMKTLKSTVKYGLLLGKKDLESVQKILSKSKYFGFGFDETDVRGGLELDEKTGLVYGTKEPFHYTELTTRNITDDDICYQVLQFHLIFPFGLAIPLAAYCLPKKKSAEYTYEKTDDLLKNLEKETIKCLFTSSDGSSTGDYIQSELKKHHPHVLHINDYIHITKNFRNRMLSTLISIENEDIEMKFNIRTFIDLNSEIENGEAEDCEVPIKCLHPRDKMDMDSVMSLLQDDIIKSCSSSKTPEIQGLGSFLRKVKDFHEIFHKKGKVEDRTEDLEQSKNFFSQIKGLSTTGNQCLRTIDNMLKIAEICPEFEVSSITTNFIENFFSVIKGLFFFTLSVDFQNPHGILLLIKGKQITPML